MSNLSATKKALLASVTSLILCCSMFVGTTYAWFTDQVSVSGNVIRAGKLEVDIVDEDGSSLSGKMLEFRKSDGAPEGERVLWEPGCTYDLEPVYVKNNGNLALRYKVSVTGITGNAKLLEVIEWNIVEPDTGTEYDLDSWYNLGVGESSSAIVLRGHLKKDAGNEYQDLAVDGISITVYATQMPKEHDSYGDQYDKDAVLPAVELTDADISIASDIYYPDALSTKIPGAYLEKAYRVTAAYLASDSPYKDWHADIVISSDKNIEAQTVMLAGQYGGLSAGDKWLGKINTTEMTPSTELRLFRDVASVDVSYLEFCSKGGAFVGVSDIGKKNNSATLKLELRLYETDGTALDTETGKYVTLADAEYTFGETVSYPEDIQDVFARGGHVILDRDIIVGSTLTLDAGKTMTLDLNGHTLSGAFDNKGGSALIVNNGDLTIRNGTVVSLAEYPDCEWGPEGYPTYATNTINNYGTLTVESGAYIENKTASGGASYAIDNASGASLNVCGGVIKAKDIAIRQHAYSTDKNEVVINGGYIVGRRAVWVHLAGSEPSIAPEVSLTVSGGVLASNAADGTGNIIYCYSYGNSYAQTYITITGGAFNNGQVAFGGGYKGDTETVDISGGLFEKNVIRWVSSDSFETVFEKNKTQ